MNEPDFLAALRKLPLHPAARGLQDDAAHLGDLILTKDMIAEGVHYLATDPPADVAWKLVAVNLSDLAAKGAEPVGLMLGYTLSDNAFDRAFLTGFGEACAAYRCPILGGDTVRTAGPRTLSLTALGRAAVSPERGGARPGDMLWVTGTIGDAAAGLGIARGEDGPDELLAAYRRPVALLDQGRTLASVVRAMMDVSDGLLIDATRMAAASGCAVWIDLVRVPLSDAYRRHVGEDRADRIAAVTGGDDYQLLFALPPGTPPPVAATRIGAFEPGNGLKLFDGGQQVPLPEHSGYQHGIFLP